MYAKILVDVMSELRGEEGRPGVLELLRPTNALQIIRNMEEIDKRLQIPHGPGRLRTYEANKQSVLDQKEDVFKFPFGCSERQDR